jgi:hypothetical protein
MNPKKKPEPKVPGELAVGELHPAAHDALRWVANKSPADLAMWQESFSSCALANNRLAEVCSGTLARIMSGKPVGERYVLGLAWAMRGSIGQETDPGKVKLTCKKCGVPWGKCKHSKK